jgi:hypothetical protein
MSRTKRFRGDETADELLAMMGSPDFHVRIDPRDGSRIIEEYYPPNRTRRAIEPAPELWARHEWLAVVHAYRECSEKRPSQARVAEQMGFDSEQPLRDRLRPLGILTWRTVHALIAAHDESNTSPR